MSLESEFDYSCRAIADATRNRLLEAGVTNPWMLARADFIPDALQHLAAKLNASPISPAIYLTASRELSTLVRILGMLFGGQLPLEVRRNEGVTTVFETPRKPVVNTGHFMVIYQKLQEERSQDGSLIPSNCQIKIHRAQVATLHKGRRILIPELSNAMRLGLRFKEIAHQTDSLIARWSISIDSGSSSVQSRINPPIINPLSRAISEGGISRYRKSPYTFHYHQLISPEEQAGQLGTSHPSEFNRHLNQVFRKIAGG